MGSSQDKQILITFEKTSNGREAHLFDFHGEAFLQSLDIISFPSYINRHKQGLMQYSTKSRFDTRQYQIRQEYIANREIIIFKRLHPQAHKLWRVVQANDQVELEEGDNIKLGELQFFVKKVCKSYQDYECFDNNFRTLSEITDSNINLIEFKSRILSKDLEKPGFKFGRSQLGYRNSRMIESIISVNSVERDCCRVCFNSESTGQNPLLNLCKCSGSVKFIHYQCLRKWIHSKSIVKENPIYQYYQYDNSCDLCKTKFSPYVLHEGQRYCIYEETKMHPPYFVLSRQHHTNKLVEYVISLTAHQPISIGKSHSNMIHLKNKTISPEHCEFSYKNKQILMRSLNPAFGTFKEFKGKIIIDEHQKLQLCHSNQKMIIQISEPVNKCLMNCSSLQSYEVRVEDELYE